MPNIKQANVLIVATHGFEQSELMVSQQKLKEATSYKSIKTDVKNAGAEWVDQEVAVDKGLITSRSPGDLNAFVAKIIEEVQEGRHAARDAAA